MKISHQFFKVVSAGAAIAICYTTVAAAQELSGRNQAAIDPNSPHLTGDRVEKPLLPSDFNQPKKNRQKVFSTHQLVSQSPPTTSPPAETENEFTDPLGGNESIEPIQDTQYLNPSANPLLFPTQPEEVETDVEQPITLQQAVELAIQNNQDLQQSRLNLERSREELQEAEADLYPDLSLQLDARNEQSAGSEIAVEQAEQQGALTTTEDDDTTSFSGTLQLDYEIYAGGERGANIRRARRTIRFQELELESITEDTRFQAATNYYNLQNADAEVEIAQSAIEDAQQTLRDAQLLEEAGLGTRFEVLQAEVELSDAQQQLTLAEAAQRTARRELAQTLSLGQRVELIAADPIEAAGTWNLSLEETIVLAYQNRAELEQFLVQREIDEQQRQIALAAIRPRLSIFANYNLLEEDDDDVDIADGYSVGATVTWTFFDGGTAAARAEQELTDIEIAETGFADQRNQVRLEVEQAYFDQIANFENIATAELAVEQAEENLRLARLRFQAGVGTQTDVIDAQTSLTDARGNLLQAIINYNQSLNQLQRAVTNLPEGRLFDVTP